MILFLVLTACGGADTTPGASATVGAEGGSLEADGVALEIPAGALDEDTEITITEMDDEPDGFTLASPVFDFSPAGLTFAVPAEVRIEAGDGDAQLFWTAASGGGFELVESVRDGDDLVGAVDHFSRGFAGRPGTTGDPDQPRSCGDGPACVPPQVCIEGVCTRYWTP